MAVNTISKTGAGSSTIYAVDYFIGQAPGLQLQIKESVFSSNVNDLNGKTSAAPPADNLVNPFEKSAEGNVVVNNRFVI